MNELAFNIVFGSIVALITWSIPKILDWVRNRGVIKELSGDWLSKYQSLDDRNFFYEEKVTLDVSFFKGKVSFFNFDAKEGFLYRAFCDTIDKRYIFGQWESLKSGATSCGCVSLVIGPHGNMMYGYWSGNNEEGGRNHGRWVLGRTDKDLHLAMESLKR